MRDLFESLETFPTERWELLEELGSGAQGQTFKARQVETGAHAAIKRLHARHVEDLKQLELFFREAEVLRTLAHPAIPRFLDAFVVGRPGEPQELHVAQSFVAGMALPKRLREGPRLGMPEVVALADQLLEVLEYLHSRAPPVFHRDIKPSNLIVGDGGRLSLVDFGVAASGWRGLDAATIVGTPGYTAPEQFSGIVGVRTDLYAVGAVLAHVVTGVAPVIDAQSGGLSLPTEVAEPLRGAILALTAPVPSNRPGAAAKARGLLRRPREPVVAPRKGAPKAPTSPRGRAPVASTSDLERAWPRGWLLALDPAPRRVDGTHASLFRRMVALDPEAMPTQSPWKLLLWIATLGVFMAAVNGNKYLWVATAVLGIWSLWTAFGPSDPEAHLKWHAAKPERSAWGRLFVNGETAVGDVRSVNPSRAEDTVDLSLAYGFQTKAGHEVSGTIAIDRIDEEVFAPGTSILVLYDAADPTEHRVVVVDPADRLTPAVYKPIKARLGGGIGARAALAPGGATREEQALQAAESAEELPT